eukprot:334868-Pleurochrysis_carterae.AAC.2
MPRHHDLSRHSTSVSPRVLLRIASSYLRRVARFRPPACARFVLSSLLRPLCLLRYFTLSIHTLRFGVELTGGRPLGQAFSSRQSVPAVL